MKLVSFHARTTPDRVAPRAGAWIETAMAANAIRNCMSLPVRGRGLKRLQRYGHRVSIWSLPVRGRGLKHC